MVYSSVCLWRIVAYVENVNKSSVCDITIFFYKESTDWEIKFQNIKAN